MLRDTVKRHRDVLVAQRLGYLLVRRLGPSVPATGAREGRKCRLLINADLEPET